jgi:NADPH:quinone reductase-like Zn-dependent oxidoreductase
MSQADCSKTLTPDGKYVSVEQRILKERIKCMMLPNEFIETGKIIPVIDRSYLREQTGEAHRYVDKGHKKGNVVISVEHHNNI